VRTQAITPRGLSAYDLLCTKEVASLLRLPARTVRLWAECSELPALKIGRQWRFHRKTVEKWLEERLSERMRLFFVR
jgi:excisionase family DNA binding protein